MIRRNRRPGLLGTAARTAVIAGTATKVSGNVVAKQQAAAAQEQELAFARAQAQDAAINDAAARAVAAQQAAVAPAPAAPVAAEAPADPLAQLERLAALHEKGLLSAEEFTAAKAKLLGL
ncbi:SHOCT domain-containing protein [Tessaracoccus sp. MC1679]|uniref:SHOCT domain-containing protein n=1 Tax=Tessaracoccus sp. MC1679 TaxID=2760313 RepID=UPI0016036400|nr:SHOCT domain-containing protein [Tessaracoccus sp. MC1679]MBB1516789.1 SHOCT domain-containing protein [Tessaracoccus sp. MC1679]